MADERLKEQDEQVPAQGDVVPDETTPDELVSEEALIASEFVRQFDTDRRRKYGYWVLSVSTDPEVGRVVIVQNGEQGSVWAVPYIKTADGWAFAQEDEWRDVEMTFEIGRHDEAVPFAPGVAMPEVPMPTSVAPIESQSVAQESAAQPGEGGQVEGLNESTGQAIRLTEADGGGFLVLDVQLIKPGAGNSRDRHWYPKEVLQRDSAVFVGSKMYESDHGNDKTTRTWVSTVRAIKGFSAEGAPIAEVVVHDPNFMQRVRNLAAAGLLDKLECSIMATGAVRPGIVEGEQYNVVEKIISGGDVDWVTRAGAGGHAVAIAEKETVLSPQEVDEWLRQQPLHEAVKDRLRRGRYASIEELRTASQLEIHYLKEVTGSGRAVGMSEESTVKVSLTEQEKQARFDEIDERYGIIVRRK